MEYPVQTGLTKTVKRMFVRATRAGIGSEVLKTNDPVLKKLQNNVSIEYPVEAVKYPAVWVTTSFKSVQWLDMNPYLEDANRHLYRDWETDRKSTRLNSSHSAKSRMPSSA